MGNPIAEPHERITQLTQNIPHSTQITNIPHNVRRYKSFGLRVYCVVYRELGEYIEKRDSLLFICKYIYSASNIQQGRGGGGGGSSK